MRKDALSLGFILWIMMGPPNVRAADDSNLVGKKPDFEVTAPSPAKVADGVDSETPNQRRRRLGLPILASYPPADYGEAQETPNHHRQRLGLPIEASFPAPQYGSAEETPNHRRERLAAAAQIADSK